MTYYAYDGDNVGLRLEKVILSNDVDEIRHYTSGFSQAIANIKQTLVELGCEILFMGGDSILACSPTPVSEMSLPVESSGFSFSVGIGDTPAMSLISLKVAKSEGKACIREIKRSQL